MKSAGTIPTGHPPGTKAHALDLSEVGVALRFCTFVTPGVLASSVGIGAIEGSLESILFCLRIAGALSLLSWTTTLLLVTVITTSEVAVWAFRRVARRSNRAPQARGGLADEWLDGPS